MAHESPEPRSPEQRSPERTRIPYAWGATPAEHARRYPCEDLLPEPYLRLTRAVTVQAPPSLVYRWVCQVSVAPYSYDWLDNLGRRSPRNLTPGADRLEVGQRAMVFELTQVEPGRQFTGRGFRASERIYGPLAGTYAVEPLEPSDRPGAEPMSAEPMSAEPQPEPSGRESAERPGAEPTSAEPMSAEPQPEPSGRESAERPGVEPAERCRIVVRLILSTAGLANALRAELLAYGDLVMMRKQLLTFRDLAERDARAQETTRDAGRK